MLHLYPDLGLAGAMAGVSNIHDFLPYHLGDETYKQIQKDIRERRKAKDMQPIIGLLNEVYDLWFEEYDIDNLYNMITGKCIVPEDVMEEDEISKSAAENGKLIPSDSLTFSNVIEQMDLHIQIQAMTKTPDIPEGIWWVIAYEQVEIRGTLRPFILVARLNYEGKICYLQGAWPLPHLNDKYLSRFLPMGYRADKNEPFVFLEIEGHPIDIDGHHDYTRYTGIRKIDSPVKEDEM
jgi:hypothetical protein